MSQGKVIPRRHFYRISEVIACSLEEPPLMPTKFYNGNQVDCEKHNGKLEFFPNSNIRSLECFLWNCANHLLQDFPGDIDMIARLGKVLSRS